MVRDAVSGNQSAQVQRILDVLGELARSNNPHNRKGGLMGLAAAAIALGQVLVCSSGSCASCSEMIRRN